MTYASNPTEICPLCGCEDIHLDDSDIETYVDIFDCDYCTSTWTVSYSVKMSGWELIADNTDKVPVINHDSAIKVASVFKDIM